MDYKYKIKRFAKSGKRNRNNVIFEKESTDKALKFYIEEFKGGLLIPLQDNYSVKDVVETNPIDIIGFIKDFDDDYIYLSEINESYKDVIDIIQNEYYCILCALVDKKVGNNTYIIDRILQVRLNGKPLEIPSII